MSVRGDVVKNNNATDFYFVDTNGVSAGAGQRLGAPGPGNPRESHSEEFHDNVRFGVPMYRRWNQS
jgi:hypothetical protein